MNTSTKCNCCVSENVCKYVSNYMQDVENIKKVMQNPTTEVYIKCSEFVPKDRIVPRKVEVEE